VAAFYLDEDVALRLARLLEERGHTFITTDEERRKGAPDARQLLHAANRRWVFLTNNSGHFRLLHDAWLSWSNVWSVARRHSGILVLPHVVAADLPGVAAAIHQLVSDPVVSLDTALHELSPGLGWTRWPR